MNEEIKNFILDVILVVFVVAAVCMVCGFIRHVICRAISMSIVY